MSAEDLICRSDLTQLSMQVFFVCLFFGAFPETAKRIWRSLVPDEALIPEG